MANDIRTASDLEGVIKILDTKLEALAKKVSGAGGFIGAARPSADVAIGNTEIVTAVVVASLKEGRRYKASWLADVGSTATSLPPGGLALEYNLRYLAGTSTTSIAGTKFMARDARSIPGFGYAVPYEMFGDFVAPSSGDFAISATLRIIDSGYGATVLGASSQHKPLLLLEDIGV